MTSPDETKAGKAGEDTPTVTRMSWECFRDNGLLWWVNRVLHLLGWAIVVKMDGKKVIDAYPARVRYRGFDQASEEEGFRKVTRFMKSAAGSLLEEAEDRR